MTRALRARFFVFIDGGPVVVTNRHNVDPSYENEKYRNLVRKHIEIRGYSTANTFHTVRAIDCIIATPNNLDEDVAVLIFRGPQQVIPKSDGPLEPFGFSLENVATQQQLEEQLRICDMLAFPGYPSWYDRDGHRPIMRVGTVASDPKSNYCWADGQRPARRMAYEAMSFSGSSGSPVIALARGMKVGPGLGGGNFREWMLVGINAGHLTHKGKNNEDQHSGISYLFKASVIRDLIENIKSAMSRQHPETAQ